LVLNDIGFLLQEISDINTTKIDSFYYPWKFKTEKRL